MTKNTLTKEQNKRLYLIQKGRSKSCRPLIIAFKQHLADELARERERVLGEVRDIIKCQDCNGVGAYLGGNLGVGECQSCGGDGHCLLGKEFVGENMKDIINKLKSDHDKK